MRRFPAMTFMLILTLALALPAPALADLLEYPPSERQDVVDEHHGTKVADPYRWLETDARNSLKVRSWIEDQNEVTFSYLSRIPERGAIRERLTELWNYEKYGTPSKEGGRYYFSHNDGLQNQNVIYAVDSLHGRRVEVFNPNKWTEDGTEALRGWEISPDGRYAAYAKSKSGSDWREWYVRDLKTGEDLPEKLEWIKWSGAAWTADSKGFFYTRFPRPEEGQEFQALNTNSKVYYHRIRTPQSEDVLAYERPDQPEWGFGAQVSEDGRYLIIGVWKGTDDNNMLLYRDLAEPYAMPVTLVPDFDNVFAFLGNDGTTFYFRTDLDAPKQRVVAVDIEDPDLETPAEIIPESDNALRSVGLVGNLFVAEYLKDAASQVKIYRTDGTWVRDVDFPGLGTASGFDGSRDDFETFYSFSSFNRPPTIYRYDLLTGESGIWKQAEVDFDPDEYVVKQVFYRSKDGTRVPMFISHRKGVKLDGSNPTLLYGYGGFNIPMRPRFSITRLAWMEMGGVYAVANLRGGGEYGEEWHKAGTKLDKQNVFDDFIAAAEHLIEQKYTRSDKLAVMGGSNGGLLVGAVMTQRPDLFGATLPAVGVMDMLRYHKFTAGRYWVDDYGSAEDPEEFQALLAYSPYHNIKKGVTYPPTLVTTADTDDRVVPGHSFKFAAQLQYADSGENPQLIRIQTKAGHGAGTPTKMLIEEYVDKWGFLVHNLDMELSDTYRRMAEGGQ